MLSSTNTLSPSTSTPSAAIRDPGYTLSKSPLCINVDEIERSA